MAVNKLRLAKARSVEVENGTERVAASRHLNVFDIGGNCFRAQHVLALGRSREERAAVRSARSVSRGAVKRPGPAPHQLAEAAASMCFSMCFTRTQSQKADYPHLAEPPPPSSPRRISDAEKAVDSTTSPCNPHVSIGAPPADEPVESARASSQPKLLVPVAPKQACSSKRNSRRHLVPEVVNNLNLSQTSDLSRISEEPHLEPEPVVAHISPVAPANRSSSRSSFRRKKYLE